jgi:hypothetical protein
LQNADFFLVNLSEQDKWSTRCERRLVAKLDMRVVLFTGKGARGAGIPRIELILEQNNCIVTKLEGRFFLMNLNSAI